jgi:hypothetical protein
MPNEVDVNTISLTYVDYSGEPSSTTVSVQSQADNAAYAAARLAFINAIAGVSNGALQARTESRNTIIVPYVSNATNANAKRELKLKVSYQDETTGKRFAVTIPCVNESALTPKVNSDEYDLAAAPVAALVTAFEAFVASPEGNTVNVYRVERVGRNN